MQLQLEVIACLSVQRRERFVHQQDVRLDRKSAGELSALLHTTRQFVDVRAVEPRQVHQRQVPIDDLAARLASLRAERPDQGVMIRGENAVSPGRMTEVYEACRSAGVRQVAISVRPKTGSSGTQIR